MTARPPSLRQLAADEVHRLDAVRALVDHGDARIAHELLHAPFGDVAVAAEAPAAPSTVLAKPMSVSTPFTHRRHQPEMILGRLALGRIVGAMRDIGSSAPSRARSARAASLKALIDISIAPHVGVHDDRVGRLVRALRLR